MTSKTKSNSITDFLAEYKQHPAIAAEHLAVVGRTTIAANLHYLCEIADSLDFGDEASNNDNSHLYLNRDMSLTHAAPRDHMAKAHIYVTVEMLEDIEENENVCEHVDYLDELLEAMVGEETWRAFGDHNEVEAAEDEGVDAMEVESIG